MSHHQVTTELVAWAKRVNDVRVDANLSQSDIQRKHGLSQSFLSVIESGKMFNAQTLSGNTVAKLQQLATTLNHPLPEPFASMQVTVAAPRAPKVRTMPTSTPRAAVKVQRAVDTVGSIGKAHDGLLSAVLDLVATGKLASADAVNLLSLARG
jgi:transcriptional regulator with XRE-family HTH domain